MCPFVSGGLKIRFVGGADALCLRTARCEKTIPLDRHAAINRQDRAGNI